MRPAAACGCYQQYRMVSAGAQLILAECAARAERYTICPTMPPSESTTLTQHESRSRSVCWVKKALTLMKTTTEIVTKTCAYTNHTILAKALEKWPRSYLMPQPQLMPMLRSWMYVRTRTEDEGLAIIDKDDRVFTFYGYPLYPFHQRCGCPAHRDPENSELHGFLRVTRKVQQDQRHHLRRWLLE